MNEKETIHYRYTGCITTNHNTSDPTWSCSTHILGFRKNLFTLGKRVDFFRGTLQADGSTRSSKGRRKGGDWAKQQESRSKWELHGESMMWRNVQQQFFEADYMMYEYDFTTDITFRYPFVVEVPCSISNQVILPVYDVTTGATETRVRGGFRPHFFPRGDRSLHAGTLK